MYLNLQRESVIEWYFMEQLVQSRPGHTCKQGVVLLWRRSEENFATLLWKDIIAY